MLEEGVDQDKEFVGVYSGSETEAGEIKRMLEGKGIPVMLQDQTMPIDQQAGLVTAGGIVGVRVLVPREDYERARELLEGF